MISFNLNAYKYNENVVAVCLYVYILKTRSYIHSSQCSLVEREQGYVSKCDEKKWKIIASVAYFDYSID